MTPVNRNQLWATAVAEELQRSGIRDVCVSPGSRSAPLALALHAQGGLRLTTHLDERSAAFFALGAAKANGVPVALLCTSGTAAANYYPAVIEAAQSGAPLVVLTADRPPELHDVSANQSIDQQRLFGTYPRFFADAGLPQVRSDRVRHLRGLVCRAVAASLNPFPGPVHLNFPFQEPLEPTPVPGDVPADWETTDPVAARGRSAGRAFLEIAPARPTPGPEAFEPIAEVLRRARRILLVAGPGTGSAEVLRLAAALGAPVLCDALSGLRYGPSEGASRIASYDGWLGEADVRRSLAPDVVLRFGGTPTSKALLQALSDWSTSEQILIDASPNRAEPTHRATHVLPGHAGHAAQALREREGTPRGGPSEYAAGWLRLEAAALGVYREGLASEAFEGAIVAAVTEALPADADLWIGSSLPVRDLERFAGARDTALRVLSNRGASGIDGVVSSALGAAHASGRRTVLILGDISFLHDLSGVVSAARLGIALDVVVLDNDGGGIFEFLPVSRHEPPFTELFVTPHGRDLAAIAKAAGWDAYSCSAADVAARLRTRPTRPRLLDVQTDRKVNLARRRALEAQVRAALVDEAPTTRSAMAG